MYRFSGSKLRALRERAGLSREQIGAAVPCSVSAVVKWELAYGVPSRPMLLRLRSVLDCRFEELFEPDPELAEVAR